MVPFVSVVVVNFNGRRFLGSCLESLRRQSYPVDRREVWLIDNASTDNSVNYVKTSFPEVAVHSAGCNLGFAAGNNLGFRLARGEYVALLNTDAEAEPNWLADSVAAAKRDDRIAGVAPRVVFRDNPLTLNSTGLLLLPDGRGADRDLGRINDPAHVALPDIFGGSGAALLLRRSALDDVGFFDPHLFMYYEDLDFAWRARARGWRFVYESRAVVRHFGGGTADHASPFVTRHVERNRVLVNIKNAPPWLALLNVAGLFARATRAALRRQMPMTFAWAVLSAIALTPTYLLERYRVRVARRRATDREVWQCASS